MWVTCRLRSQDLLPADREAPFAPFLAHPDPARQAGVGLLGEAGEVAVRRHVHATLLPEVLQRQAAEARRITG